MNITAQALVFAVASVATAAAIGTGLGDFSAQPAQGTEIVKLERVVVVGKRADASEASMQIVQLPRVVVTGHRVAEPDVQVASSL
ncbi:MAG TPA: hypothetical protein VGM81_03630 [Burkholderiaceae bacterium]